MNEDEVRGRLITRLREDRLWTREELAKHAGVTPTTVTQAEAGRTHVRLRTIGKLADALGVPPARLLRPTEEKELATAGKGEAPETGPGKGDSYEEAAGSTPEERAERAEALADVAESMVAAHRDSLGEMSEASAGELFGLYMQASLIHVGLWHLIENEGYAGLTREGRLEAALGELSRVAEEIEQAMAAAEAREELPEGVASLAAHQRRRATPARDTAPTGPSRRVYLTGGPSWAEQATAQAEAEAPTKGK